MTINISGIVPVSLSQLTDVSIISPQANQYLRFDGLIWQNAFMVGGSGTVSSITAGTGLSGGTITTTGTIALGNTSVTAGSYTAANITVDAQGRITSASNGTSGVGVSSFNTRTGAVVLTANDVIASLCNTNTTKNFIWNATTVSGSADAGDASSLYIQRNANYTGGTPGVVNAAIYVTTNTPSANSSYEYGVVSEVNSYSNNLGGSGEAAVPQNVAINGTIRKYGTAPVWAGTFAAVDPALTYTVGNDTLTGLEVNVAISGNDTGLNTVGVDSVSRVSNTGLNATTAIAYRASGSINADWKYGYYALNATNTSFYSSATGIKGVELAGNYSGIIVDTSTATGTTSAIRINDNSYVELSASGLYKFKYNNTNGFLEFYNGATRHGYINITSGADIDLSVGAGAGVSSFNTRTGAVTLTSSDVTTALGYTPYNATNPSGYTTNTGTVTSVGATGTTDITISGSPVTTAGSFAVSLADTAVTLGTYGSATQVPVFTVDSKGRITGVTNTAITAGGSGTVTSVSGTGTVSGLTLTGSVTTSGSLTLGGTLSLTSGDVTTALGYTPYDATNPSGYTTNTGTVTSVAALTIDTAGTDLSSSVATSTTTPVITLSVPTASASNRGALSAADWSTFNSKGSGAANDLTGTTLAANVVSSSLTSVGTLTSVNTSGTVVINGIGTLGTQTLTTSTTAVDQIIDSVPIATYRVATYRISVTSGSSYQYTEVSIMQDGVNSYINEINTMVSGVILATFTADISSGNMRLLTTPVNAVTVYKTVSVLVAV